MKTFTLEPRKDVPTLIDAFARIAPARPELTLVIAGRDGWGAVAVRDAAAAFGEQKVPRGQTAVFSLHATKPVSAGEGGSVLARASGWGAGIMAVRGRSRTQTSSRP